jgi:hypothetical protein
VNQRSSCGKALFAVSMLVALLLPSACVPNKKYSAERWKKAKAKDRQFMADNFLQTVNTTGLNLDELVTYLGEPDYPQNTVVYYLDSDVPPLTTPVEIWSQRPVLLIFLQDGVVTNTRHPEGAAGGRKPFDASLWRVAPSADRMAMCLSLLNDITLHGMSVDDVEALLGRPDEQEVNYDLGVRLVDTMTLTFIIDRDRNVVCAQTIER